ARRRGSTHGRNPGRRGHRRSRSGHRRRPAPGAVGDHPRRTVGVRRLRPGRPGMNNAWHVAVAVPVAVGAAASFGTAGFLQHQAAQEVPPTGPLRPGLLYTLIKVPKFRWGVSLAALGFALQVVALDFAPLAIVQPILVTGLLFYLGLAALAMRRPLDRLLLLGALLALAGLIGFLVVSQPAGGSRQFT